MNLEKIIESFGNLLEVIATVAGTFFNGLLLLIMGSLILAIFYIIGVINL